MVVVLTISTGIQAREVDNYMAWGVDLADEGPTIDAYLREKMRETITVADDNFYDLLLGVNFNHWFNDKWAVLVNADTAVAGDNDRDYSLDVRGLYRISSLNNVWFGFRYLNIGNDTTSDGVDYAVDMKQVGPTLGWAFTL